MSGTTPAHELVAGNVIALDGEFDGATQWHETVIEANHEPESDHVWLYFESGGLMTVQPAGQKFTVIKEDSE